MSRVAAFRFLCDCLSSSPPADLRDRARSNAFSWTTLLTVAHEHRITSALAVAAGNSALADVFPSATAAYLSSFATHSRKENDRIRQQATEVSQALNEVGVTPLFMKGGAHLLSDLYLDIAQRQMADLDILIPEARIGDCVAILDSRGITGFDDYLHPRSHHCAPLSRADLPVPIELHHEVLAYPYGSILTPDEMQASSVLLNGHGARIAVPSPGHALIHNIAHAQRSNRDCLFGRIDLRGLLDFALIVQTHGTQLDWDEINRHLMRKNGRTAVDFAFRCARELLNVDVPQTASESILSKLTYQRAMHHVSKPKLLSVSVGLTRPWPLLRRELSDPALRRRLARNLFNSTWWKRHTRLLMGR